MFDDNLVKELCSIPELQKWMYNCFDVTVIENCDDCFTIQCPCDTAVTIFHDSEDDIDNIICRTVEMFEEFDANEKFTEYWGVSFAKHNNFTPRQFIDMLSNDEKVLHKMACQLRSRFH